MIRRPPRSTPFPSTTLFRSRRQNLVPAEAMPYDTGAHTDGHPVIYDSGDYALLIDKACERFDLDALRRWRDRKSTRLNSSHANISYAVFCLKKKTQQKSQHS